MTPIKAIRAKCLDCGGSRKAVLYCTCDGINSTKCELWPYRFGYRPPKARKVYGDAALDPHQMPDASIPLADLPSRPPSQTVDSGKGSLLALDERQQPRVTPRGAPPHRGHARLVSLCPARSLSISA